MKEKYSVLLVLIWSLFSISCRPTETPPPPKSEATMMLMPWKLTDYYILPNAMWSKSDANKLLFKEAFMTKNSIKFNGQTCKNIRFNRSPVSLKQYLSNQYNISVEAMKLTEHKATIVSTNCNLSGFKNYLQLDDGRILIVINGVGFFLVPAMAY